MTVCQCSEPIRKHLLMEQTLPFLPLRVWGCDNFILLSSDSNGGVDDSREDNEVFVPGVEVPSGGWVHVALDPTPGFHFLW